MEKHSGVFKRFIAFENQIDGYKLAAKNKRYRPEVLDYSYHLEDFIIDGINSLIWKDYHIDHVHEIADGASECSHINDNELRGKKVLVVDDIVTTGKTANAFIDMLQTAGADVRGALFLAKTKNYRRNH